MLTLRTAQRRLWKYECPAIGSLRGSVARVLDHHAGRCGARGARPARVALCARPAAGGGTQIDRTSGQARARCRGAGPAAILGTESLGLGASPLPDGSTD